MYYDKKSSFHALQIMMCVIYFNYIHSKDLSIYLPYIKNIIQRRITMKIGKLLRCISSVTCFIFMFTTVAMSAPQTARSITIPEKLGSVARCWQTPDNTDVDPVVIIQDAHSSRDAQENIAGIIGHLTDNHGLAHVGVEGAAHDVAINDLRAFPDAGVRAKAMKPYLDQGVLNGATYQAIVSEQDTDLFGLEDTSLYKQHYEAYMTVMRERNTLADELAEIETVLESLKTRVSNETALMLIQQRDAYQAGQVTFLDYFKTLLEQVQKQDISLFDYTQLMVFSEAVAAIARADEIKAQEEEKQVRALVLQFCHSEGDNAGIDSKNLADSRSFAISSSTKSLENDNVSLSALRNIARVQGIDLKQYSNFIAFALYNEKTACLEWDMLFRETTRLHFNVVRSLVSVNEQTIITVLEQYELFAKIVALEAANNDVKEFFVDAKESPLTQIVSFVNTQDDADINVALFDALLHAVKSFYVFAHKRDTAMIENHLAQTALTDQSGMSAIVAGGYHATGMTQVLRKKNIPYVVVTPRVDTMDASLPYHDLMVGSVSAFKPYIATLSSPSFLNLADYVLHNQKQSYGEGFRRDAITLLVNEGMENGIAENLLNTFFAKIAVLSDAQKAQLYMINQYSDRAKRLDLLHAFVADIFGVNSLIEQQLPAEKILAQAVAMKDDMARIHLSHVLTQEQIQGYQSGYENVVTEVENTYASFMQAMFKKKVVFSLQERRFLDGIVNGLYSSAQETEDLYGGMRAATDYVTGVNNVGGEVTKKTVRDDVAQMQQLYQEEKYEEMSTIAAKILESDPMNVEAGLYRGFGYYWFEQYKGALDILDSLQPVSARQKAMKEDFMGRCYIETGNTRQGVSLQEHAITLDPSYLEPHLVLMRHYNAVRQYYEAKRIYDRIPDGVVPTSGILNEMYYISSHTGNSDKAIQYLHKAIELDPQFSLAYENLIIHHLNRGGINAALAVCDGLFESVSASPTALGTVASVFSEMGEFATAQDLYERAAKMLSQGDETCKGYGMFLMRQGHYGEAVSPLMLAKKDNPNDVDIYRLIAKCYIKVGDTNSAKNILLSGMMLNSHDMQFRKDANTYFIDKDPSVFLTDTVEFIASTVSDVNYADIMKIMPLAEIKELMQKNMIVLADEEETRKYMGEWDAGALLLPDSRYLVLPEIADDPIAIARAVMHEDTEALMQIMRHEDSDKYHALMKTILGYKNVTDAFQVLQPTVDMNDHLYGFNDMIAKVFDLMAARALSAVLTDKEQAYLDAVYPVIQSLKSDYFTSAFWNYEERCNAIGDFIKNGGQFEIVAISEYDKFPTHQAFGEYMERTQGETDSTPVEESLRDWAEEERVKNFKETGIRETDRERNTREEKEREEREERERVEDALQDIAAKKEASDVAGIMPLLKDHNAEVAKAAKDALFAIGDSSVTPFVKVLRGADAVLRTDVIAVLEEMGRLTDGHQAIKVREDMVDDLYVFLHKVRMVPAFENVTKYANGIIGDGEIIGYEPDTYGWYGNKQVSFGDGGAPIYKPIYGEVPYTDKEDCNINILEYYTVPTIRTVIRYYADDLISLLAKLHTAGRPNDQYVNTLVREFFGRKAVRIKKHDQVRQTKQYVDATKQALLKAFAEGEATFRKHAYNAYVSIFQNNDDLLEMLVLCRRNDGVIEDVVSRIRARNDVALIQPLLTILRNSHVDEYVRNRAAFILGRLIEEVPDAFFVLVDEGGTDALCATLLDKDNSANVRIGAAWALIHIVEKQKALGQDIVTLEGVIGAIYDAHASVRKNLAWILRAMQDERRIDMLKFLVFDKKEDVSNTALNGVKELSQDTFLMRIFNKTNWVHWKYKALEVLAVAVIAVLLYVFVGIIPSVILAGLYAIVRGGFVFHKRKIVKEISRSVERLRVTGFDSDTLAQRYEEQKKRVAVKEEGLVTVASEAGVRDPLEQIKALVEARDIKGLNAFLDSEDPAVQEAALKAKQAISELNKQDEARKKEIEKVLSDITALQDKGAVEGVKGFIEHEIDEVKAAAKDAFDSMMQEVNSAKSMIDDLKKKYDVDGVAAYSTSKYVLVVEYAKKVTGELQKEIDDALSAIKQAEKVGDTAAIEPFKGSAYKNVKNASNVALKRIDEEIKRVKIEISSLQANGLLDKVDESFGNHAYPAVQDIIKEAKAAVQKVINEKGAKIAELQEANDVLGVKGYRSGHIEQVHALARKALDEMYGAFIAVLEDENAVVEKRIEAARKLAAIENLNALPVLKKVLNDTEDIDLDIAVSEAVVALNKVKKAASSAGRVHSFLLPTLLLASPVVTAFLGVSIGKIVLVLLGISGLFVVRAMYKRVKSLTDTSPEGTVRYAFHVWKKGRISQAYTNFRGVVTDSPDYVPAYTGVGALMTDNWMRFPHYEVIEKQFLKARELEPDNVIHVYNLGLFYLKMDEPEKAQKQYDVAVAMDQKFQSNGAAHLKNAITYYTQSKTGVSAPAWKFQGRFDAGVRKQSGMGRSVSVLLIVGFLAVGTLSCNMSNPVNEANYLCEEGKPDEAITHLEQAYFYSGAIYRSGLLAKMQEIYVDTDNDFGILVTLAVRKSKKERLSGADKRMIKDLFAACGAGDVGECIVQGDGFQAAGDYKMAAQYYALAYLEGNESSILLKNFADVLMHLHMHQKSYYDSSDGSVSRVYVLSAIALYEKVLKTDELRGADLSAMYVSLGKAYFWIGNFVKVDEVLARSVSEFPENGEAYVYLLQSKAVTTITAIMANVAQGKDITIQEQKVLDELQGYAEKAVALQPDDFRGYAALALSYFLNGEDTFDEGLALAHKALAMVPEGNTFDRAIILNNIGSAFGIMKKDYDTAIEYLLQARSFAPFNFGINVQVAAVYELRHEYSNAVRAYWQALDCPMTTAMYVTIHDRMRLASRNSYRVESLGKKAWEKWAFVAKIHRYMAPGTWLRPFDEDKTMLQRMRTISAKKNPTYDELCELGTIYGKYAWVKRKAIKAFNRAIAMKPDNAKAYIAYGDAMVACFEDAQALEQYEKALALSPDNAYVQNRVQQHAKLQTDGGLKSKKTGRSFGRVIAWILGLAFIFGNAGRARGHQQGRMYSFLLPTLLVASPFQEFMDWSNSLQEGGQLLLAWSLMAVVGSIGWGIYRLVKNMRERAQFKKLRESLSQTKSKRSYTPSAITDGQQDSSYHKPSVNDAYQNAIDRNGFVPWYLQNDRMDEDMADDGAGHVHDDECYNYGCPFENNSSRVRDARHFPVRIGSEEKPAEKIGEVFINEEGDVVDAKGLFSDEAQVRLEEGIKLYLKMQQENKSLFGVFGSEIDIIDGGDLYAQFDAITKKTELFTRLFEWYEGDTDEIIAARIAFALAHEADEAVEGNTHKDILPRDVQRLAVMYAMGIDVRQVISPEGFEMYQLFERTFNDLDVVWSMFANGAEDDQYILERNVEISTVPAVVMMQGAQVTEHQFGVTAEIAYHLQVKAANKNRVIINVANDAEERAVREQFIKEIGKAQADVTLAKVEFVRDVVSDMVARMIDGKEVDDASQITVVQYADEVQIDAVNRIAYNAYMPRLVTLAFDMARNGGMIDPSFLNVLDTDAGMVKVRDTFEKIMQTAVAKRVMDIAA